MWALVGGYTAGISDDALRGHRVRARKLQVEIEAKTRQVQQFADLAAGAMRARNVARASELRRRAKVIADEIDCAERNLADVERLIEAAQSNKNTYDNLQVHEDYGRVLRQQRSLLNRQTAHGGRVQKNAALRRENTATKGALRAYNVEQEAFDAEFDASIDSAYASTHAESATTRNVLMDAFDAVVAGGGAGSGGGGGLGVGVGVGVAVRANGDAFQQYDDAPTPFPTLPTVRRRAAAAAAAGSAEAPAAAPSKSRVVADATTTTTTAQ